MKFSFVIGNPPYLNGMHTHFLRVGRDLLEDLGQLLLIHPSTYYVIQKPTKQAARKWVIKHQREIVSLKLFNGNSAFKIASFVPLAVIHLQKGHDNGGVFNVDDEYGSHQYTDIHSVNLFGDREEYRSFKKKVFSKMTRSFDDVHRKLSGEWFVDVARIRAHPGNDGEYHADDFFTFFPKDTQPVHASTEYDHRNFAFATEEEAWNCISYLKTKFARRCLSLWKYNQHLDSGELGAVPFVDFSEPWDDARCAEEFGLSEAEKKFVQELPEYH